MFPTAQGYYVWAEDEWKTAETVPCDHIIGWKPNASFLMRDLCEVDDRGLPAVAYAGLLFDGVSWINQHYGLYFMAGAAHDSGCAICRSLPPSAERIHAQANVDLRFYRGVLYLGMAPHVRAWAWYRIVKLHAWLNRNRMVPDYVTHLEAYYRFNGLPDRAIAQGLRIAEKHRRTERGIS
jgi:hypothetical protein